MIEELQTSLEFKTIGDKEISSFTESFKTSLLNANNPKLFLVVGKSREGKSTLLNHLLLDKTKEQPNNLRLSKPFRARGGEEATTKEFLYYGPIKMSEFCRRNKLEFRGEDNDCYFIDTEGAGNLYQMSKNLYHGIFALESVATCILFVSKGIIDHDAVLYISRHIQTSMLFNSSSKNSFPGFAIVGRDIGIQDYDIALEQQELERIKQDNIKLNDLKTRLIQNTGINFSEKNLKYLAEPPLDMTQLFYNSIKDLSKFIIDSAQAQNNIPSKEIITKFNQQEKFINKYPILLDTNASMEETFNKVFSLELEEAQNKVKEEKSKILEEKLKNLSLLDISKIQPDKYINDFISELEINFENETNSRFNDMKKIVESKYNISLLNLKKYFETSIKKSLDEKIEYFINQMKIFIEKAKNESEILIIKSISEKVMKLSSQQMRELNIEQYINNNLSIEIQKFYDKANSLFENLKNIQQTKELFESKVELLKNIIKVNIKEKLESKMASCPPWPKDIPELLKEQNIDKLKPDAKYILYLNKKPYEIIARKDGKISIPNVKALENYRKEELPCWRNGNGLVYNQNTSNIDNWFEPNSQILILSRNYVYQRNWEEGGHRTFFGGGKPPRPQQEKTTISIHVSNPWTIKSFDKSGSVSASLNNNKADIFISGTSGSIYNIKLELK